MAQLDTLDLVVLASVLLGTLAYLTKGSFWARPRRSNAAFGQAIAQSEQRRASRTRDIAEKLRQTGKNCVIFYGSQTGTAEDFATRLAKEGKSRFGLETMAADLEDYDYDSLDALSADQVVMFILATYGEGEPTDNAVEFYEFLSEEAPAFSQGGDDLSQLRYVAFGLGNTTYEQYNSMVRNVDKRLQQLHATRIGPAGEGDDGAGSLEEDFLAWKETMWSELAATLGLQEREAVYEPVYSVEPAPTTTIDSPDVYLGEPTKPHLLGTAKGPYNAHNPYIAPIAATRELFNDPERNCVHLDVDINGSNLTYQTGDHLAVWPMNSGYEVDKFLAVLGLTDRRHQVVHVKALENTAKVPFPTPTTLDTIARYYLEISAPISRQFAATLAAFAPNAEAQAEMTRLGTDKEYFHQQTSAHYYTITRLLAKTAGGPGAVWDKIPFSVFIEGLTKLQPRYYSISSSSLVQPRQISITAVVDTVHVPSRDPTDPFRGVTTNYLLALKHKHEQQALDAATAATSEKGTLKPELVQYLDSYTIGGPRDKYVGSRIPVHVRHSGFKLPSNPSRPIIMIGPGTGVAPFRAFVQERAHQASVRGEDVGRTLLFFGCRHAQRDFLYDQEWSEYQAQLGDRFELITAFSRDGPEKVYVQHRLEERAAEINTLLQEHRAYVYVCGDAANMAREVQATLVRILARERNIPEAKAEDLIKRMRAANQYHEDVWS